MALERFSRTELETYYRTPVVAVSGCFVLVKWGWYSTAFVVPQGTQQHEAVQQALQHVEALFMLEE